MKPFKLSHLLTFLLLLFTLCVQAGSRSDAKSSQNEDKKILLVVSSYGENKGKTKPGFEFDELAQAYLVLSNNNISIDIASPNGGRVEPDEYNPNKPFNKQFLENTHAKSKLEDTLKLSQVNTSAYDGVFVMGGKGAMFDFHNDKALQKVIRSIYENNGTVAAVCHGPAALANVKLSNGEYLVKGKAVNGFTNQEESMFGKKWLKHFEFKLEDKLKQRGGEFESNDAMLSHVAVDSRLITGQNPASTAKVADELVRSIGLTPKVREPFAEEKTLDLIAQIWSGNEQAIARFKKQDNQYNPQLVAMYGYYQSMHAKNDATIDKSIELMELSRQFFQHPTVELTIAKGYKQLGKTKEAKRILEQLIADNPKMESAKSLLATM
jgi:putative intracellular protease/amidase